MDLSRKKKLLIAASLVIILGIGAFLIFGLKAKDEEDPLLELQESFVLDYVVNSSVPDWSQAINMVSDNVTELVVSDVQIDSSKVKMETLGEFVVIYTLSDKVGNTCTKELTIHIISQEAPVIYLRVGYEFTLDINDEKLDWSVSIDSIFDNNDTLKMSEVTFDDTQVDMSKVGKYTVIMKIIDSDGNEDTAEVFVNVVDNTEPTFIFDDDFVLTYEIGSSQPEWVQAITAVSDNATELVASDVQIDSSTVEMDTIGEFIVVYTVSDETGNICTKEITIHIVSPEVPVITLKAEYEFTLDLNDEKADWSVSIDSIFDTKDTLKMSEVTFDDSEVDMNTVGKYKIILKITDSDGYEDTAEVFVTVIDNEDPTFVLDDSFVKTYEVGSSEPVWTTAILSMNDNTENSTLIISSDSQVTMDVIGVNDVTLTVTDINGNKSSQTMEINIIDTENPNFTFDETIDLKLGIGAIQPDWLQAISSVSDNYDTMTKSNIVVDDSTVDLFNAGLYSVSYELVDTSDNTTSKTLDITVGFYVDLEEYFVGDKVGLQHSITLENENRILLVADYSITENQRYEFYGTYLLKANSVGEILWINKIDEFIMIEDAVVSGDNAFLYLTDYEDGSQCYVSYNISNGVKNESNLNIPFETMEDFTRGEKFADGSFFFEIETDVDYYNIYKFNADATFTLISENTTMKNYRTTSQGSAGVHYVFKDLDTNEVVLKSYNNLGVEEFEYSLGVQNGYYSRIYEIDENKYYITTLEEGKYILHLVNTETGIINSIEVGEQSYRNMYDKKLSNYESGEPIIIRVEDGNYFVSKVNLDLSIQDISLEYIDIDSTILFDQNEYLTLYVTDIENLKVITLDSEGNYLNNVIVAESTSGTNQSFTILNDKYLLTNYLITGGSNQTIVIDLVNHSYVLYDELTTDFNEQTISLDEDKIIVRDSDFNSVTDSWDVSHYVINADNEEIYYASEKIDTVDYFRMLAYRDSYSIYVNSLDSNEIVFETVANDNGEVLKQWAEYYNSYYYYYNGNVTVLSDGSIIFEHSSNGFFLDINEEIARQGIYMGSKDVLENTYHIFAATIPNENSYDFLGYMIHVYGDDGLTVKRFSSMNCSSMTPPYGRTIMNFEVHGDNVSIVFGNRDDDFVHIVTGTNYGDTSFENYMLYGTKIYADSIDGLKVIKDLPEELRLQLLILPFSEEESGHVD